MNYICLFIFILVLKLVSNLLWPMCSFKANITSIVLGFIRPIPRADLLEYRHNLGNFSPNPIFFKIIVSYIFISSSSYLSLINMILDLKYTFLYKYILKKIHTVDGYISISLIFATDSNIFSFITLNYVSYSNEGLMYMPNDLVESLI